MRQAEAEHRLTRAIERGDEDRVADALDRKSALDGDSITAPDVIEPELPAMNVFPIKRNRKTKTVFPAKKRAKR